MNAKLDLWIRKALHTQDGPKVLELRLKVASGDLCAVCGPSGSGKTTLLRLIAGLDTPDEGHIIVNGKVWFDSKARVNLAPQKRNTGMVFQDYALFPNMTLYENLRFALRRKEDTTLIDQVMETLDIHALRHRKPGEVSGGQRQRTAYARALVSKPDLMLLDEPFSALDWELRWRLQDELRTWHEQFSSTTLLVSHDLLEIYRLTDKVYRLGGSHPSEEDLLKASQMFEELRTRLHGNNSQKELLMA